MKSAAPVAVRPKIAFATALLVSLAAPSAHAANVIFTCVAANGRTLTSDRLIAECMDREQRVLSRDGILQRVIAPALTADERAAQEARERRAAVEKEAKADAARRDRNLLSRYPTETGHRNAREAALEDVRASMKVSQLRLAELERERKPLLDEAEFYKGKALPPKLKQQIDAVDAAEAAQRQAMANQQGELARVTKLYDIEFDRLKRLWAGAAPGSLGPLAEASAPPAAPVPAARTAPASSKNAKKP